MSGLPVPDIVARVDADSAIRLAATGLHWSSLDEDYSVPGLMNGVFGTARWMAQRAVRATSPKKGGGESREWHKGTVAQNELRISAEGVTLMESVETALIWLIGLGVALMVAGLVVMRLQKKK
jgi:hypothetical protein